MLAAAHMHPLSVVTSCFAYLLLPATAGNLPPPFSAPALLPYTKHDCCCFPNACQTIVNRADQSFAFVATLRDKAIMVAVTWEAYDWRNTGAL